MKGAVMRVVQLAVGALQGVVAALMTADALVCDFACLISDPGAPRQRLHADTTFDSRGSLLTLFIALQDVTAEMGGTLVLPGTASRSGHAALDAMSAMGPEAHQRHERHWLSEQGLRFECESLLWHHVYLYFARKVRHSEVFWHTFRGKAGDAMLMHSRVLHCGGANTSSAKRRRMLYVTFKVPFNSPRGNLYSILPEYEGKCRLRNVDRWHEVGVHEEEPTHNADTGGTVAQST
jgi:ectoine hydroxylase-related dioxygenase (phytanoyl-CoA dioxygenase family)